MKIPNWAVPVLLRLLSLTGLTSAQGQSDGSGSLRVGFELGPATTLSTESLSQPRPDFSLDLDFFVQVANHEFKIPIMPLHLLGKKSWNVYNTANIEKVKRDEARAKALEEAEEQRMQELDAERRMQILRGEIPTPLAIEDAPSASDKPGRREHDGSGRERKRRKKAGENDTDFEMRIAREQQSEGAEMSRALVLRKDTGVDKPLVDHRGHIDLFPQEKRVEKNAEAEKELAKKKKEYEDQYTMKFSNAAGFKQGLENPWYSKAGTEKEVIEEIPGKDVWGNEDPRRKERELQRIVSSDPLAMMKRGAAQARKVESERKKWREEKEREMMVLEEETGRKRGHKRRREDEDLEDLEDFRLDEETRPKRYREERSESRRSGDGERERRHRHKESRYRESDKRDRERDRERGHRRREHSERDGERRKHRRHHD